MAGRKYSDIYKVANTATVANTDLFAIERANGNTYVLQANAFYAYVSGVLSTTRSVTYVNTTSFTANSSTDVIFCNPSEAGANVTITLPADSNNKTYTVKCLNTTGQIIVVTTSNTSQTTIEAPIGGAVGNATSLTSIGEVYTWLSYNGVYRKIS